MGKQDGVSVSLTSDGIFVMKENEGRGEQKKNDLKQRHFGSPGHARIKGRQRKMQPESCFS
ncbi:hypothetical protein E2562_024591 [Oryza meyeriana var. granulata]|uniref:Uncharacterized protein n=1 Tax=Oryza meyeriana var. granulata TaxID=110450 RepID=A0A6G1DMN6_9ORYZ|nr:hypothetical protein E2562_024591 [Oryza meyeriana var. granulata]